jgi:hypothetical protein
MHSEEVSSEGSLAESLSCAKECGRRPQAILVAEPLKVIKPLQHPGRSGISHHPSPYVIECQRHQNCGHTSCSGLDGESRKTVRAFFCSLRRSTLPPSGRWSGPGETTR